MFKITQGIFFLSTEDADSLLGELQTCMQILDGKYPQALLLCGCNADRELLYI